MLKPKILNWNVAGAKFLKLEESARESFRIRLNQDLAKLVKDYEPDVVALQEIVLFGDPQDPRHLIEPPPGYNYDGEVAIDTIRQAHPRKWQPFRQKGGWLPTDYLAQGNGLLWKADLQHSSLWDLSGSTTGSRIQVEVVRLDTGLYTGDRDTEPRLAVVYRFILSGEEGTLIDLFIVNTHLTTLKGEREGLPAVDELGTGTRMRQLDTILHGIVSRYNEWRSAQGVATGYKPPVWVITGDFNSTPASPEIERMHRLNFLDLNPNKGKGNKASGLGKEESLTVDYIFAGPKFVALNPYIAEREIQGSPTPFTHVKVSDHFPILAEVPIATS